MYEYDHIELDHGIKDTIMEVASGADAKYDVVHSGHDSDDESDCDSDEKVVMMIPPTKGRLR